jgi:hypothetical protein
MASRGRVTAYLPEEIQKALEEWAEEESRSVSSLATYLLTKSVRERQEPRKKINQKAIALKPSPLIPSASIRVHPPTSAVKKRTIAPQKNKVDRSPPYPYLLFSSHQLSRQPLKRQPFILDIHKNRLAVSKISPQNTLRHLRFQLPLNSPLQRPRTVNRIVTNFC